MQLSEQMQTMVVTVPQTYIQGKQQPQNSQQVVKKIQNSQRQKLAQSVDFYINKKSLSQLSSPMLTKKQSDFLSVLIKSKVSVYMTSKPMQGRMTPLLNSAFKQNKKNSKLVNSIIDLPRIRNLDQLIEKQKQLYHIYRQKMEFNFDQCLLYIICSAVKHQYQISHATIDKQNSLLIECFIFVANSLAQIGNDKLAFYFCVKAIRLCQVYMRIQELGQMLLLMGCITRKMQRFQHSILFFKKGLEYLWRNRNKRTDQKQIQTYGQMSQCLLQINRADESKIFAHKYELGYLEKNNSKIIQLSHQLIDSVQSRKSKWHAVSKESMELLLQFDIQEFLKKNYLQLIKMDQKKAIQLMKINFQFLYENFLHDDMFFYEIPMPLEIIFDVDKSSRKKVKEGTKFLIKKRSSSVGNLRYQPPVKVIKTPAEKPKQFLIFNYRGVGVSKQKLSNQFTQLVNKIDSIKNHRNSTVLQQQKWK